MGKDIWFCREWLSSAEADKDLNMGRFLCLDHLCSGSVTGYGMPGKRAGNTCN